MLVVRVNNPVHDKSRFERGAFAHRRGAMSRQRRATPKTGSRAAAE